MGKILSLKYPKKSHRKAIMLPPYSAKLAEFFGIMMGDGSIGNPWQANITLNSIKDLQYASFVTALCMRLFGIVPAAWERKNRKARIISLTSISLIDFLVANGLKRGNKLKQGLAIPAWILERRRYRIACIRGLMDTDGCIYIHRHTVAGKLYKNIGLCFTSYSRDLIFQVAAIFEEFGIIPHISTREQNIYLYKADSVTRYLSIFGTSNDRIRSVYREWEQGGVG